MSSREPFVQRRQKSSNEANPQAKGVAPGAACARASMTTTAGYAMLCAIGGRWTGGRSVGERRLRRRRNVGAVGGASNGSGEGRHSSRGWEKATSHRRRSARRAVIVFASAEDGGSRDAVAKEKRTRRVKIFSVNDGEHLSGLVRTVCGVPSRGRRRFDLVPRVLPANFFFEMATFGSSFRPARPASNVRRGARSSSTRLVARESAPRRVATEPCPVCVRRGRWHQQ